MDIMLKRIHFFPKLLKHVKQKHTLSAAMKPIDIIQETSLAENCILIDENDHELGPASKKTCHLVNEDGSLLLHRAFSVFVFNSKNEILLQQRSSTKVTYPSHYTNACCSHPLYDIEQERNGVVGVKLAAQRRLNFELGIPASECSLESLQYLTRLHYMSRGDGIWGEHEIDYIFILHKDLELNPNPDEVNDVRYLSQDKLIKFLHNSKHPFTPWFQLISTKWLTEWWNNLHQLHKYKDNNINKFNK